MVTTLLQSKLHTGVKRAGILKVLCLLWLIFGLAGSVLAQTATIPTGNVASNPQPNSLIRTYPYGNSFPYQKSIAIYLGSEIAAAAGVTVGTTITITHISYYLETVNGAQPSNVRIKLEQTANTTFPTSPNPTPVTYQSEEPGSTQVFSGVITVPTPPAGGTWVTTDITDFSFNTGTNLEVFVESDCISCASAGSSIGDELPLDAKQFRYHNTGLNQFIYFTHSTPTSTVPGETTTFRPNIQFTVIGGTPPPTCAAPTAASPSTSNVTQTSATVNFTPAANQTAYQITFTPAGGQTQPVTNTGNSFNLTGLTAGTTYNYEIRTDCGSTLSSPLTGSFTTSAPTPTCTTPTDLAVTQTSTTAQLTFTDNSGSEPGTFLVKYGTPGFDFATAGTVVSGPPYNVSGLTPSTTYEFAVQKTCTNGAPSLVERIQFTTDAAATCNAPTTVSGNGFRNGTAQLTFSGGDPNTSTNELQYSTDATFATFVSVNPATSPTNLSNLTPGTYSFRVRTTCTNNVVSGFSPVDTFIIAQPVVPQTCDAPTAASVTTTGAGTGPNTVLVNYTPSSTGASGVYFITYTRTAPTAGSPVTTQLTSNPFTLGSLDAGATYSFTVFKDCDGTADGTGTISTNNPGGNFTTQAAPVVCDAPTAASPSTSNVTQTSATVNFTPAANQTAYQITFTPTGGQTQPVTNTGNSFNLTGLTAGTTYNYEIRANCSGTLSNALTGSFTTQSAPTPTCTTPTDLAVTKTSTTAQLTFTDNSGSEPGTFLVKYGAPGFDFATAGTVVSGPPYNVSGLTPSTTYEFAVQKTCTNGAPSLVEREQFTTDAPAQPCDPPTAGSVVSNNPNEITVTHTASSTGASGNYFIAYTPTGGGTTTTVALTSTSQTITSVPAGTYSFTIYKDCSGIQSTGNPTGTFTVQDAPLPPVCTTGTWLGTTSSDWHTASNWCNGIIPDGSTNVIIPANTGANPVPNYPVIKAAALVNNITIQTNATLTLSQEVLPSGVIIHGVLTINGNYINLGTLINNGEGSLVFNSPTPQTLGKPGNILTFLDLSTGPGGVIQGGPVRVKRVLTLNGNLTTLGNELTLLADQVDQSMVVNNGSAVVVGTATMEKYINPGNNQSFGYRHLTSPVANATISQLHDDFPLVVNPNYNTNPTPGTTVPFPTIYRYNETRLDLPLFTSPNFDTGWESPNDLNEVMAPAVGYTVNMLPVEIDFTGTLNNGPYTRTLTRGNQARSGYNFLGNPYPAPLNWDLVNLPPNMDRAAYVVRSTGQYTGTYVAYVNGIPANGEYIAAMQGFFVRVSTPNSTASLTFENDDRATTYVNPALYKKTETRPVITLALRNAAGLEDKTYVYFETGATVNFDGNYDAFKMPHTGPVPSIFSRAGNDQLAINGLPLSATTTIIPLGGKVPQAGTWTIAADQIINFLPGQSIYLEDIATNTLHNLGQQNSYTFSTTQTDLSGRFFLRFGPGAVTGITPAELAAKVLVYPNPNQGQFTLSMPTLNAPVVEAALFNAVGQKVWSKALKTDGLYLKETITTQKLSPGVYLLRLETNAGPVQRKIIIE